MKRLKLPSSQIPLGFGANLSFDGVYIHIKQMADLLTPETEEVCLRVGEAKELISLLGQMIAEIEQLDSAP